jgi:excisionase family DNA binding protein
MSATVFVQDTEVAPTADNRLTFTVAEAAALLGISATSAWKAVNRNEIPHLRIGNRVLVSRVALLAMIPDGPDSRPAAPVPVPIRSVRRA